MAGMSGTDVTEDLLLGGQVRIRQPARGYRVNVDTVLLAAAVPYGARLLEAGCGVGGALLCVARRYPESGFVGVERDPAAAALAAENVELNGAHAEIICADILDRDAVGGGFDGVFLNPPFDAPGEGNPPAPERQAAHVADAPLEAWIKALADKLTGGGALTLIHKAEALPLVLAALKGRLGSVAVRPVAPRAEAPAGRILVRALKGGRAPFRVLPALALHDDAGAKYSGAAEAVLRGGAAIPWDGPIG